MESKTRIGETSEEVTAVIQARNNVVTIQDSDSGDGEERMSMRSLGIRTTGFGD